MNSSTKTEINSIIAELRSIISELESISSGINSSFDGIGEANCASTINNAISNYEYVIRKLNNIDDTSLAQWFIDALL
ncbi:MAG: hypothetical protein R3Y35_10180 [Clostridia bacterium]